MLTIWLHTVCTARPADALELIEDRRGAGAPVPAHRLGPPSSSLRLSPSPSPPVLSAKTNTCVYLLSLCLPCPPWSGYPGVNIMYGWAARVCRCVELAGLGGGLWAVGISYGCGGLCWGAVAGAVVWRWLRGCRAMHVPLSVAMCAVTVVLAMGSDTAKNSIVSVLASKVGDKIEIV